MSPQLLKESGSAGLNAKQEHPQLLSKLQGRAGCSPAKAFSCFTLLRAVN